MTFIAASLQAQSLESSNDQASQADATLVSDRALLRQSLLGYRQLASGLPDGVEDLVGFHRLASDEFLAVLAVPTELADGLLAEPRDVAHYHAGSWSIVFDGAEQGVPKTVGVDAVSMNGSTLLLSFDDTVSLFGVLARDEDVVAWTETSLSLFWDASADGVSEGLDLDGLHLADDGTLLVSFDGVGELTGGGSFRDEDVVAVDSEGKLSMFFQSASVHGDVAHWSHIDLDALSLSDSPLFEDNLETATIERWND